MDPINNGGKTDQYTWTQTAYDLTVSFPLENNIRRKDILLHLTPSTFSLKNNDKVIFEGTFPFEIKVDNSTWFIEDSTMIIEFDKCKKHEWWKCMFVGDVEIDTSKVSPPSENFSDLDSSTKATIEKMLYEQEMKKKHI